MAKKEKQKRTLLLQTNIQSGLAERFFTSPEYRLHGNISAALRAILDSHLPQIGQAESK